MFSKQNPRTGNVRKQTNDCDNQHPVRFHGRRIQKAVICLVENVKRDENQEYAIQQGRKNLHTIKPICHARGCTTAREPHGEQAQA